MKRFFYLMLIIALAFLTKPLWIDPVRELIPVSVSEQYHSMREFTIKWIDEHIDLNEIDDYLSLPHPTYPEQEQVEKPNLEIPENEVFSIGNIKLGDSKSDVYELYGEPVSVSENEYGLKWSTYHENYQNFIMVMYDEDETVQGLFTNQDMFVSQVDLVMGDTKEIVRDALGDPKDVLYYDEFGYQIDSGGEYDIYQMDNSIVTIFYDLHAGGEMTAIQLIAEELEMTKSNLYASGNEALRDGFEYQLFDLTNATRVNHGLNALVWDEGAREPARAHSTDMAENQFFSHTNLADQTFSDRLIEAGITFRLAGENLAYGQFSSIFAHQGLMNSIGHRENILHSGFMKIGIGVDFNEQNHPFYTEKFFTD